MERSPCLSAHLLEFCEGVLRRVAYMLPPVSCRFLLVFPASPGGWCTAARLGVLPCPGLVALDARPLTLRQPRLHTRHPSRGVLERLHYIAEPPGRLRRKPGVAGVARCEWNGTDVVFMLDIPHTKTAPGTLPCAAFGACRGVSPSGPRSLFADDMHAMPLSTLYPTLLSTQYRPVHISEHSQADYCPGRGLQHGGQMGSGRQATLRCRTGDGTLSWMQR